MSVTTETKAPGTLGTVRDYGDQALLLEFDSTADVLAWTETVTRAGMPGVLDIVPASRTVLLKLAGPRYLAPTRQRLSKLAPEHTPTAVVGTDRPDVVIEVTYDGADLDAVAELTGLSVTEVIAAHTGTPWQAAFVGFAPGFAYLIGGDPRLAVPRRAQSRTEVPAGSVALAGEYSAVYPRRSPGGWQLIGTTEVTLWDQAADPPAAIQPGRWVRFVNEEDRS